MIARRALLCALAFTTITTITAPPAPLCAQDYRLPLQRPGSGATQPYVTAYRDHDGGGGLEDWSCSDHTYDGHRGTDLGIGGFAVMDDGSRWVVAAADGDVTFVSDGCFDRCTSGACDCGGGFGNYVRIEHADGKRTYYGHMMNGSVAVSTGDHVTCGQRLGKVASSGHSTGPHLHFEPRYADNTSDDPFGGACGGPTSFWVAQGAYRQLPEETCAGATQPPPDPPPPPPEDPPPPPEDPPPPPEEPAPLAPLPVEVGPLDPTVGLEVTDQPKRPTTRDPDVEVTPVRAGGALERRTQVAGGCTCTSGRATPTTLTSAGVLVGLGVVARVRRGRARVVV